MTSGNLDLMKCIIIERGCTWNHAANGYGKRTFNALKRHLSLLKYVHKNSCQNVEKILKKSVGFDDTDFLYLIHETNYNWNNDIWMKN